MFVVVFYPPKPKTGALYWFIMVTMIFTIGFVAWLLFSTFWGASTLEYEVTPSEVVITYRPKVIRISREDIRDVYVLETVTRGTRLFGTSMPGLKQGTWSFAETGRITLYATNLRPLTVIETDERKWGISPAEPEAFVAAVLEGAAQRFAPVESAQGGLPILLAVLLGLTLVVCVSTMLFLHRLTRHLRYELTGDALLIHGGWSAVRVPYRNMKKVRIESPSGWPVRVGGVSMTGLYWGQFTWRSLGKNVRIYATRLKPVVAIDVEGKTIAISPEEDERFVEELSRLAGWR